MSDDTTQEQRWQFRAYHETPEHAALRGQSTPPPEPITVARQQLALAIRQGGFIIDLHSVREENREAVVVNEAMDDWSPAREDETPTGHLVLWTATGRVPVGTDASDPVLDVEPDDDGVLARVPEPWASTGGSCRIRHNLGGNVTVLAYGPDGDGIGYLFATTLDANTVHMEFFGGTAAFHVTKD